MKMVNKRTSRGRGTHNQSPNGRQNRDRLARFQEVVGNVFTMRRELLRTLTDPRKDIDDECGYPKVINDPQVYQYMFDREPVATRVVEMLPKECFQVQPSVYESEDPNDLTPFEAAWDHVGHSLLGENSYYQDEEGNPIWEYLLRMDILSGIGSYGVMLLGIDDGKPLDQPLDMVEQFYRSPTSWDTSINALYPQSPDIVFNAPSGSGSDQPPTPGSLFLGDSTPDNTNPYDTVQPSTQTPVEQRRRLLFIRCFPESLAQITAFDQDPNSPRYTQPTKYLITFNDPQQFTSGVGLSTRTETVHWTRVIHVADNRMSNETFGVPRMRPVFNPISDIKKVRGGSGEMYWRGAFPGWSFETQPQLGGEVDINKDELRDMIEDYMNGLQRYLALTGMSAKSLAPQVVDPTPQIAVLIEAICIRFGFPIRIFKGSERGELASSQDDQQWNDRIRHRQRFYVTPHIVVPFVNRLIAIGILPRPSGFSVFWPDLTSQSKAEKADIAVKLTTALAQFIGGGGESALALTDFYVKFCGFTEDEARQLVQNARPDGQPIVPTPTQQPKGSEMQSIFDRGKAFSNLNTQFPPDDDGRGMYGFPPGRSVTGNGHNGYPSIADRYNVHLDEDMSRTERLQLLANAWTDEAREAALEARQSRSKNANTVADAMKAWPHGASVGLIASKTKLSQKAVQTAFEELGAKAIAKSVYIMTGDEHASAAPSAKPVVTTPSGPAATPPHEAARAGFSRAIDMAPDHPERVSALVKAFHADPGAKNNLVDIADLSKALGQSHHETLSTVGHLRRKGVMVGGGYEGRHGGINHEQQAVLRAQPGEIGDTSKIGFVSIRHGKEAEFHALAR